MESLIVWLEGLIQSHGWLGLLAGTFLEEIIIPLPSSLIMMGGGFLLIHAESVWAALGQIIFYFIPIGLIGVMTGSLFWYGLSYRLEELVIKRLGKYIGVSWDEVKGIERFFKNKAADEWILFCLRAIPIFPGVVTAILMGLIRMPPKKFIVFGTLGTAVRLGIMGFLGWVFQEMYVIYANRFEHYSTIGTIIMLVALGIGYFFLKKYIQKIIVNRP